MRIITYSDPRLINEIEDWENLMKVPQLCVSQTLVQGLSHKCGRKEFGILSTIDKFLNEFYSEWKDNSMLSIKQYIDITEEIKKIEDIKLRKVFYENRNSILKSIRLLIEAEVYLDDLSDYIVSDEFDIFKKIYSNLLGRPNWNALEHSKDKGIEAIKTAFYNIMIDDIIGEFKKVKKIINRVGIDENILKDKLNEEDLKQLFKRIEPLLIDENTNSKFKPKRQRNKIIKERIINAFKFIEELNETTFNKIILHGIHQFNPLTVRLIKHLESKNIEVIFLINFNDEYKEIYNTWEEVYKWTEAEFEKKQKNSFKYSYDIGKDYANAIMGNFNKLSGNIENKVLKFDNLTEFSNYVADIYEKASNESETKEGKLAKMEEQFYSVNGEEVNKLLSVYFPEQFGEKHFLSYPIGQFILGLYNMWDFDKGRIVFSDEALRECLGVNLWIKDKEFTPIEIYKNIRVYLNNIEEVEPYIENIDMLIKYVKHLNLDKWKHEKKNYELLSFFSVTEAQLRIFKDIILDLKNIAERLFNGKENVVLSQHYKELLLILKERAELNNNISEKEYEFVEDIFKRLETDTQEINSAIKEVKMMIHFYLSQNKQNNSSNWIVRDFEQLDGGVFLADDDGVEYQESTVNAAYHYAEISDNNINNSMKVKMPWPLRDEYFKSTNEVIQIYLTSKKEYSNFLKYTLFYGMYYLNRDIKISYIENVGNDKKETLYFILKLLGLKEESYTKSIITREVNRSKELRSATELVDTRKITKEEARMISFCPRRFFYEGLIDKIGTYHTDFLCKRYIKIMYGVKVIDRIRELGVIGNDVEIEKIINERIELGKRLIPSWERDFQDIKAAVIATSKNILGNKDIDYNEIKMNYLSMIFSDDTRKLRINKCKYNGELEKNKEKILLYIKKGAIGNVEINPIENQCRACKYVEICSHVYREGE